MRIQTLLVGDPAVRLEKRYVRPDGAVIWVIKNVSRVLGHGDETPRVLAVVQDQRPAPAWPRTPS